MRKVLFLLGQLSDSDLDWMIAHGQRQRVAAGTVLIREGRDIDMLYLLLDGVWEVSGSRLGDKPIRLSCGEIVGEMSLLDSRPPVATVTVAADSIVLAIPRADLKIKTEEDAEFAARFYRSLAIFLVHRLRNTYQRFGYGKGESIDEELDYEDELSPELLDSVHVAAIRFDRALRRLLAS
jgi:CRP/FNR family transcriptional regulator, cyclic AMP receptor protein